MQLRGVAAELPAVQERAVSAGEVGHAKAGLAYGLEEAVVARKLAVVDVHVVRRGAS